LNIPAALAVSLRLRPAAAVFTHHIIKGSIQPARFKSVAGVYLFSAFPPVGGSILENVLLGWFYGLGSSGFDAKLEMGGDGLFF
jgi:hypothetical protein